MKQRHLLVGVFLATQGWSQNAPAPNALPSGGHVVAGEANIDQSDSTLSIHQSSDRAAIDWNSFDVGGNAHVEFLQPSNSSVTLNRVTGGNASQIFGRITANGQVFLSNPNGTYFAPGASVNVGGLVATTHSISVEDFMAGRIKFARNGATGSIVNEGELKATLGGYIALLAPEVRNQGVILANLGTVALAAGETFELQFGGNNTLANLRVTPSTIQSLVDNRSAVLAPGGIIILSAQAMDRVQGGVIRNSGVLEATGLAQRAGRIVLEASGSIHNSGRMDVSATADGPAGSVSLSAPEIENSGSIVALGSAEHPGGGRIEIAAGDMVQTPSGLIDVSAPSHGGILSIEASGAVVLSGRVDATATADDNTSLGGDIAIDAAQIELASVIVDVSGSDGGQIIVSAIAAADQAPSAPVPAPEPGKVALLGTTQLSSRGKRGRGGSIKLLGDDIGLHDGTALVLIGSNGGGRALIGGDWQGQGELHQAITTTMSADAYIDASATETGDGGKVVLWSDVQAMAGGTLAQGSILTRGGSQGGNGGQIETSGHAVDVSGLRVDASATHGNGGSWLIDPFNYTIDAAAATSIATALNASTSVLVTTTVSNTSYGGSTNSGDSGFLTVASAIAKTSGSDATLTLQGHRRVNVFAPITSTSGRLNVVLWSDYANANLSGVAIASAITTNGGHVWIGGSSTNGGSQTWNGLTVGNGPSIGSSTDNANGMDLGANINTGGGDALLWVGAGNTGSDGIGVDGSQSINAGSGNVTLITNRVFNWQNSGNLTVNTTGTLTLAPAQGGSYSAAFDWTGTNTSGNLQLNNTLSANTLTINSVNSLTGFVLGRYAGMSGTTISNTSGVTVSSALSVAGPISIYGGQIAINANLTSSATGDIFIKSTSSTNPSININADILKTGGARSTLTLQAQGRILLQSGKKIQATGTALDTIFWSDYDNSNDEGGVTVLGNVTTNGGHLWAGGSNSNGGSYTWNGLNVGDGASIGSTNGNFNAMDVYGAVSTSGGDVLMWVGNGAGGGTNGINTNSTGSINAGSGNVTMLMTTTAGTFPITTTGTLTLAPNGGSYGGTLTWSGSNASGNLSLTGTYSGMVINSVANVGGLSLGQYSGMLSGGTPVTMGNSNDVTLSVATGIAGPLSVYGGNITTSAALSSTLSGADFLFKGTGNVVIGGNLTTNGGDIALWSDSDASGAGGIKVNDSVTLDSRTSSDRTGGTHTTGGGVIAFGGGLDDGGSASGTSSLVSGLAASDGRPDGYAVNLGSSAAQAGILLGSDTGTGHNSAISIFSGGGDIRMQGRTTTPISGGAYGVMAYQGLTVNAGTAGNITLLGNTALSSVSSEAGGFDLAAWRSTGYTASSTFRTVNGNIVLVGRASGSTVSNLGIAVDGTGSNRDIFAVTGSGALTFDGLATGTGPSDFRLTNVDALAASGNIQFLGHSATTWINNSAGDGVYIGAKAASLVTSSTSNVLLQGDAFNIANGLNVNTTGTVTVQSSAASFSSALAWSNVTLASTVSGLTLGKTTNTANVVLNPAQSIAGPISVYGGGITVNGALASTAANQGVLLKGTGAITDSANITTNGGDITLWANSSGATAGGIQISNNITLASSGGAITLGGSAGGTTIAGLPATSANGTTLPQGYAQNYASSMSGLLLGTDNSTNGQNSNVSINSGNGNISIAGHSSQYFGTLSIGLLTYQGINVNAGTGNITLNGLATGALGGSNNIGFTLAGFFTGGSTASKWQTNGGTITMNGAASGATAKNVGADPQGGTNGTTVTIENTSSTSGSVTLNGTATGATTNVGIQTWNTNILSRSGSIALNALGASGSSFTPVTGYTSTIGYLAGSDVTASSGNITITADALSIGATLNINSTGALTVQPNNTSFSSALTWLPTNLNVAAGLTGLTLGKSGNTADITVSSTQSIDGPISVYGGNILTSAALSSTSSGAGILLKATGNVVQAASTSVTTAGGNVIYWADSDNSGAGGIQVRNSATITSNGGAITLAGGLDDGGTVSGIAGRTASDGRPDGYAVNLSGLTGSNAGVLLGNDGASAQDTNISISSGGGDIAIFGKSTTAINSLSLAVQAFQGYTIDAGTSGNITLNGLSQTASGVTSAGFDLASWRTTGNQNAPSLIRAVNGNINITGLASGGSSENLAISLDGDAGDRITVAATGVGNITLNGNATGTAASGLRMTGADVLAASGNINVQATAGRIFFTADNISFGARASSVVTSSSSNISIQADSFTVNTTPTVTSTGALVIESTAASFGSAFTNSPWSFDSNLSGLRLGKSGNTADITVANAQSIAGPISLYGGNLAINAGLTATSNTITLQGTGNVTDGASGFVSANNLALLGGNVTLDSASNSIGTLAASGVSGLTYVDSNALTVGTVGGTNGISASGVVSIGTLTGDLTVTQSVATTNTTNTALTLNAGVNAAAGTASGGNLIVTGSPTVIVGSGGRARLFTGSVSGSTGLTTLVGSGSGRFRYNSDESATNYTLALGTGLYAIYREQPTISRTIDNQSMTYGATLPTYTFTAASAQNGDTFAQAFATAPSVSVGGANSTSGNPIVGAHSLTGSGGSATSQLGYAVSGGIAAGLLTVTSRTLTVSYTGNNKVYDGNTTATVNDSDDRVSSDVFTVSETADFINANAGNGKTVNVTGIGVSGTDASNYSLASTSASTTANLTPRTVTLSGGRAYDGTTTLGAGTVTIGNLVGSETLTFSGASANDAHVATAGKFINAITLLDGTNGGLTSNYQLPTLNVANAPVTLTARALGGSASIGGTLSRVYNGTASASGASVSGSVTGAASGDTISLDTSGITLAYNSAHVASATSISASGTLGFNIGSSTHSSVASDYSFTPPSISSVAASITPATLTPTLTNTGVTKTYDGTTNAPAGFTSTWSFAGLVAGDTSATLTNSGATYNSKDVATASNIVVSGLSLSSVTGSNGSLGTDYVLDATSKFVAASITTLSVTVSGLVASDKIYDGNNTATITNIGSANTGVGSETLNLTNAGATFSNANAGSGKIVTAIGYALADGSGGGLAGNYALTSTIAMTTADITQRTVTLSGSRVYDGTTTLGAGTVVVGNLVGSETLSYSSASSNDTHVAAANNFINAITLLDGTNGGLAGNYQLPVLNAANAPVVLTARAIGGSASIGGTLNRAYDGTTSATGANVSGSVTGAVSGDAILLDTSAISLAYDFAHVVSATTIGASGTLGFSIDSSTHGSVASDYSFTPPAISSVSANITPRPITVTGLVANNKTYDGSDIASITNWGSVNTGVGSETLNLAATNATFNNANAGNGKTVTVIGYSLSDGSNGGLASNYALTSTAAATTANIIPRTLTLSGSRIYDGTTTLGASAVTLGNLVGSETLLFSGASANDAHVATAGKFIDAITLLDGTNGGLAGNYQLPTLNVANAPVTFTARAIGSSASIGGTLNKAYDGTTAASGASINGSITGAASGDTISLNTGAITLAYNSANVANATAVSASGTLGFSIGSSTHGSVASDYSFTPPSISSVSANITPRPVTVSGLIAADKTYDGTDIASIIDWGNVTTGVGSETLTLAATSATFSDANAGNGKMVTALGYALFNGSNGGLASNYALTNSIATTTANINKATLTVVANDDAKFVTRVDLSGYNGLSYSGFVNGETIAVLSGSASISRSNAGTEGAGTYVDVLVPDVSGLSSNNYSFVTSNGDYTIVPSNRLLVRVANDAAGYGTRPNFTMLSAEYLDNSNNVIALTSITNDGNGRFTVNDGAGGSASFNVALEGAMLSSAGFEHVGSYQLDATSVTAQNAQNFSNQLALVGSRTITPRGISATTVDGVSKVYDGTTAMTDVRLGLIGAEAADNISASGTGAFGSRNVGTNIGYTLNGVTLGGNDAANYYLTGGTSFSGGNGTITPRTLVVNYSGVSKVYDGNTSAAVTTTDDRIAGDILMINRTAAFADKNVGTGKIVTISGITLGGADANNYAVTFSSSTTASITQLNSVTWIGGTTGNWFDPANWAGGAVPDLSNVANVVIPAGVDVIFDTTGIVVPAQNGTVNLNSLGTAGSLTQNSGQLTIGSGGIDLHGFTQHGGTLDSSGDITLNSFTQTGGQFATTQDFNVDGNYNQGNSGLVSVGGDTTGTDTLGDTTLGNLSTIGTLHVASTGGNITQADGTTLTTGGTTTVDAGSHDIALNGTNNNFIGAFNASGNNVAVTDGQGGLVLGDINASGTFAANSTHGDITQTSGSTLAAMGSTTLRAPDNEVTLNPSGNNFGGGLVVVDATPTAVMPPILTPAAPSLSPPSPTSAPTIANSGVTSVAVLLITIPSDQNDGLVRVEVPKDVTPTGFSFALPEEITQNLPAGTRIIATRENGGPLPAWLTFDAQRQRFVATAIPAAALPLRIIVTVGTHRLTLVIAIAEAT